MDKITLKQPKRWWARLVWQAVDAAEVIWWCEAS